jgi:hypothetical protein
MAIGFDKIGASNPKPLGNGWRGPRPYTFLIFLWI